jgi:predicted ATPase
MDGSRLCSALAEKLQVRETPRQTLEVAIKERLRTSRALLVLDNCEHLIPACVRLCGEILAHCPNVRVLATSREPLGLKGEWAWPVPGLAFPDPDRLPSGRTTALRFVECFESVRLFVERATTVRPSFELGVENMEAVASICARLEGVPLAIELAAARVRSLDAAEIAVRLDDSLRLLTAGFRTKVGRQNALRTTLDWSYDLLSEDERRLLRKLSIFVGGWIFEAAGAVAGEDVGELLGALVDKSLASFDLASGRYRLLETVRQYASEKLASTNDDIEARSRRANWCIELAEEGSRGLIGPDQASWLDRLQAERPNLLAAMTDLENDPSGGVDGLRLSAALARFWHIRGPRFEGIDRHKRALDHPGAQEDSEERVRALNCVSVLIFDGIGPSASRPWAEAALEMRRRTGDSARLPGPLTNLGNVLLTEGDHVGARRLYEECAAITEASGDLASLVTALSNVANLLQSHLGEAENARRIYERVLTLSREVGGTHDIAFALQGIGFTALLQGEYDVALTHQKESYSMLQGLGDQSVAWSQYFLGDLAHASGEPAAALSYFEECLPRFVQMDHRDGMACVFQARGKAILAQGDARAAREEFDRALELNLEVGRPRSIGEGAIGLAVAEWDLDQRTEAVARLAEAMSVLRAIDARRGLVAGLEVAAQFSVGQGDPWTAARLIAAADRERLRAGSRPRMPDRERIRRACDEAGTRLGSQGFAAAWRDGTSLSFENATAEALTVLGPRACLR